MQLEQLSEELIRMGILVRESIDMAVKALIKKDKEAARLAINSMRGRLKGKRNRISLF
jgi:phosphate uptake regulator